MKEKLILQLRDLAKDLYYGSKVSMQEYNQLMALVDAARALGGPLTTIGPVTKSKEAILSKAVRDTIEGLKTKGIGYSDQMDRLLRTMDEPERGFDIDDSLAKAGIGPSAMSDKPLMVDDPNPPPPPPKKKKKGVNEDGRSFGPSKRRIEL